MAKKISLINMKGGVGKSTLAVNLAWHFVFDVDSVMRVLLVDLDPQSNASQYLIGVTEYKKIIDNNEPTIWDVFEQFTHIPGKSFDNFGGLSNVAHEVVSYKDGSRVDLIPSRLELSYSLKNPGQKEQLLAKFISKIEKNYEVIIFDCPPTESILTTAAYLASEYILVPVKPEYLSTIGLPLLARSMSEFKKQYEDHNLELAGIVFNDTSQGDNPEKAKSKDEVWNIAVDYGWYVFSNEIDYSRSYPRGAREGQPIFRTPHARKKQSGKFMEFYYELRERIKL